MASTVKKTVAEIDPDEPVMNIMSMTDVLAESIGDGDFSWRYSVVLLQAWQRCWRWWAFTE